MISTSHGLNQQKHLVSTGRVSVLSSADLPLHWCCPYSLFQVPSPLDLLSAQTLIFFFRKVLQRNKAQGSDYKYYYYYFNGWPQAKIPAPFLPAKTTFLPRGSAPLLALSIEEEVSPDLRSLSYQKNSSESRKREWGKGNNSINSIWTQRQSLNQNVGAMSMGGGNAGNLLLLL